MKRLILGMAILALLFPSCTSDQAPNVEQETQIDMSDFRVYTDVNVDEASKSSDNSKSNAHRTCYTMQNLNRLLNENPGLEKRMYDIEYQTRRFIASKKPSGTPGGGHNGGGGGGTTDPPVDNLGVINIPVNFIVVYDKSEQNVDESQLDEQIAVLNADFRKTNSDKGLVPSEFSGVASDTEISFTKANVYRHHNTTSSWSSNDAVKYAYPAQDPSTHLNIWVCNLGGGLLGYAQFPGGPSSTDGVVILYSSLPGGTAAPYNEGRTATHEVGHYLNLRHIWGDGRCKQDDFVADTPSSDRPNYGCPSYPTVHCRSTDMTMNYMDYTDDPCMYMFTEGQKERMRAIFLSGGPRESIITGN